MMVRLVSCHVRECRQAVIDRERDRNRDITNKKRKEEEHRTEYVHGGIAAVRYQALGILQLVVLVPHLAGVAYLHGRFYK
jgi:hypothetical protein